MNIMDFVSQLQVGIKELEDTGRLGFSEGISKIFINGLFGERKIVQFSK